jgi:hypothetical protein
MRTSDRSRQEDHALVRAVSVNWHLVWRKIVIDEEADTLVDHRFLVASRCFALQASTHW